jgi:hypothetical protein
MGSVKLAFIAPARTRRDKPVSVPVIF